MPPDLTYHTSYDDRIQQSLPRFNPAVLAEVEERLALQRITGQDGSMPELALAVWVVKQAFHDLAHASPAIRADARDFLLRRLWDGDYPIGQLLRHFGVRRFDRGKLIHAHIHIIDGDTDMNMAGRRSRQKRQRRKVCVA